MTPRAIRRAAERRANKLARKATASEPAVISEAQLAANQANAQLSTGPRTEAGKVKASLNAVTSGLTGHTVLLHSEDADAYQNHLLAYQELYQPLGPIESVLVQSIADTSWRLLGIPGLEMALFAKGQIEFSDLFEDYDPAHRLHLIDAHTFTVYAKQIRNLQLQESRLLRRQDKETAELKRLQAERQQTAAPPEPALVEENGFEFSPGQMERLRELASRRADHPDLLSTLPGYPKRTGPEARDITGVL